MMFGKRELALGAKVDPRFGPVVMLSDGGKFIESMPDYHLLVPPFSIDNACKGLKALRIAPLFHGARGEPPLPIECVAKLAVQLGDIMLRNEDRSEEHTSELQSLMRISYAVFCLTKKQQDNHQHEASAYKTRT